VRAALLRIEKDETFDRAGALQKLR